MIEAKKSYKFTFIFYIIYCQFNIFCKVNKIFNIQTASLAHTW